MRNDIFTMFPPTFEPQLTNANAEIETFLELEYQGETSKNLELQMFDDGEVPAKNSLPLLIWFKSKLDAKAVSA